MNLASLLSGALLLLAMAPARATVVSVNPERAWTTWEGWGCSLAWWANQFGTRDDLADALFTTRAATLTTDSGTYPVPGLGLNIVRYNIGGTADTPSGKLSPAIPPAMTRFKQIQGFWLNGDSEDPQSASFNWNADADQRAMLLKARDRGADLFEAFSDSPMWWMCANHSTAGSASGGDNLLPANYARFAAYLAIVAAHARKEWGISLRSVEPFNEPSAWWWKYPCGQEGCHFDLSTQKEVVAFLRSELDMRGLQDVAIAASDENSVDNALTTWEGMDSASRASIGRVNAHAYAGLRAYRGPNRAPLYQAVSAAGKPLWQTEAGEADGSGKTMAKSIMLDLNEMHATAWVCWQPYDSGGWGLVQSNPGDNWIGPPNPKYYVMAQFSRHIRPGMLMLDSGNPDTIAAYDPAAAKLVLVTLNTSAGETLRYDLTAFRSARGPVSQWTTLTDGSELYVRHPGIAVTGSSFDASAPANSVQTFEVSGVKPRFYPVVRINASGPVIGPYEADRGFAGGSDATTDALIDSGALFAAPPGAYRSRRNGRCAYTIGGLIPGRAYSVRLHFAETTLTGAGMRRFDVSCNGVRVLRDLDVFAAAGGANKALVRTFTAATDPTGAIRLAFTAGAAGEPMVSAIEVLTDLTRPYSGADMVRALAIHEDILPPLPEDAFRLSQRGGGGDALSMADVLSVARAVAGLDANPEDGG